MSLIDAIASLGQGAYTVTRTGASTTDGHGRRVPGAESTFQITASIQPVSGRELRALPEAYHTDEVAIVYTTTELLGEPRPDSVAYKGNAWNVIGIPEKWEAFGGIHYRAYIARQKNR
jgi:hypothetical protein